MRRALSAPDATIEMELAAALMTEGAVSRAHLAKAASGATDGSVLGALIIRADGNARSLADVRSRAIARRD